MAHRIAEFAGAGDYCAGLYLGWAHRDCGRIGGRTVVAVREGARALDTSLDEMARAFALPRGKVLWHVVLPQLAPYLAAAGRTGLSLVWKIVLIVELLGRPNGIGFQIGVAFQLFDVTLILAYALAFVTVILIIETAVVQPIERRAFRWRNRAS